MLFRLLSLLICLVASSLHAVVVEGKTDMEKIIQPNSSLKAEQRFDYNSTGLIEQLQADREDSSLWESRIRYDEVEEQTYKYYASGRLQEAKNKHALVSFRYNNMGLPVEERLNEHCIQRTYDKFGQIASLTSSLGANLTYERNEFGELINFTAQQKDKEYEAHFSSNHEYDGLGFELERMLPGGISQSFAYDNIGRLVDSKTRQSSKMRRERKYHWGKADRLLKAEDSRYGTTTYEYSPTGHLQKATYADGREEYRLSDKVGNLFDDPDCKLRKYLRGGKIEQSGDWRFEYDKDGQLIEKYKGSGKWWDSKRERWKYEWNQNGTLKAVHSPHRSRPVRFAYDALGRRLCKLADEYTHWVWNGNVPLHEWNSGDTWKDNGWQHYELDLKTWVFEEESFVPMALLLNSKAYSIVTDQLGTPTEAYNAEGDEVWSRRLDMNGNILEENYDRYAPYSEQIRIPFLFQGQYYDYETELAYNRFRYYSPELGRYISEDPIRFESGTTALHSYVDDSNGWIDSLGLSRLHKLGRFHGKKPRYTNPGHHDPSSTNFRGGGSKTSILPQNAEEIYRVSIPDDSGKHWYAKSQDGTIHRFGNSNDGTVHWNGSTNSPRRIKIPPEVSKRFDNEGYTPAPNATYKKK